MFFASMAVVTEQSTGLHRTRIAHDHHTATAAAILPARRKVCSCVATPMQIPIAGLENRIYRDKYSSTDLDLVIFFSQCAATKPHFCSGV